MVDLLRIQRDLGVALSMVSTIRPAMRKVLEAALSLDGIDGGGVYLVKHSSRTVELIEHKGLSSRFIRIVSRYDMAAPLVTKVLRGVPLYRNSKQIKAYPLYVAEGLLSVAAFPIRYSRDVIAVLNVASRTLSNIPPFTRTLLEAIASQIGTVVPRIRAETERRDAEKNLRSLLNTVGDFFFICDRKGKILEVNKAVPAQLGYTRGQLIGQSFLGLHPPRMRAEAIERMSQLLAGTATECLVPLMTRTGEEIPVETKVADGRWNGRRVLFGLSRDVRERMKLEKEVILISEAEKSRMAQDLHDNVMQQLSGISLLTAALKRQLPDDADAAGGTADRILQTASEALAASRRSVSGLAPYAPVEGGMALALQILAQNAKDAFGCECRTFCRIDTAPLAPAISTQLYYIAQESIRNACTHGGARQVEVHLRVDAHSGAMEILDDGSGIAEGPALHRGMGLRIMQYRADMIGGRLTVSRRSGGGARVQCLFRIAQPRPLRRKTALRRA